LISQLLERGHVVRALVRPEGRLARGAISVPGNALDASSFADLVPPRIRWCTWWARHGHRWPYLLMQLYAMLRWLPSTREAARRLGLVTRLQMIHALVDAVQLGPNGIRVTEVEQIRSVNLPA
jgi:hypothetical protein